MDNIIFCIMGLVLIVSAHAARFDQGLQAFNGSLTSDPELKKKYETKEVIFYLTPNQVKALEAGGAFVRPENTEDEPAYQAEENEREQEEDDDDDQSIAQEQNNSEQPEIQQSDQNSELEELLKKIYSQIPENIRGTQELYPQQGESQDDEETERDEEERREQNQSEEEGDYDGKELENTRQIPARFAFTERQNSEKYLAPSVLSKQKQQAKNTYVRPQPNYRKSAGNQQESNEKVEKKREGNKKERQEFLQNKPEFIPIEETPQEGNTQQADDVQEKITNLPLVSKNNVVRTIVFVHHRGNLKNNEKQLKKNQVDRKVPRYDNKQYAIQIEKLRENVVKQNALARAEILAKSATSLNKEKVDANRPPKVLNNFAAYKLRAPTSSASLETDQLIPVSIIKRPRSLRFRTSRN